VLHARSLDLSGTVELPLRPLPAPGAVSPAWGRFVAAAAASTAPPTGAELVVASSVPRGSGLSSSAALCVALVLALGPDAPLEPVVVARAARDAEVLATGVPVGLMDQLASVAGVAGSALLIDCRSLDVEPITIPEDAAIGVVHSGLPRALAASAYAARRAACEAAARRLGVDSLRDATLADVADDPIARHVVSENQRVLDAAAALRAGDLETVAARMRASHQSLRDDFAVSTPELDLLVDLLVRHGALGARLTGAGFGGCVVALARAGDTDRVLRAASDEYRQRTGRVPRAFPVRAVAAAGVVPGS
jgi:galactokinase